MLASVLISLAAAGLPGVADAQSGTDLTDKRSDLDDLKRRIRDLQKDMAQTEASRSGAAEAVAEAERAVSRVQRRLREIEGERAEAEKQVAALEAQQQVVLSRIAARQGELGDWLRRHYMHGPADGVAPLLAERDPNQIARDAHYLEHLGRARLELIDGLRADLRDTRARAADIAARRDRLVGLESEQRRQRTELESVHVQRRQALAALSVQLQSQRKEVSDLQQDEQRLARLIDTLVKRAREQAAREAARRAAAERRAAEMRAAEQRAAAQRAAEQRAAEQRASQARSGEISPGPPVGTASAPAPARRVEPVVAEVARSAGPTPTNVNFGQLRGQLHFPVRGELIGRFGAQRAEGGTTWKGVFIRAASGSDVRAVAAGEVVFSDWLRGYGNLLIIDHGGDYLSVYGNNDALLKEVGAAVKGGDVVASVGAGGGVADSGLYFEIRHQGRPLDPMQWVRLR
ncbi:peptidase M23 [Thauera sinica]|nr:peptidase M23 [Thauera sp. K11]